MGFEVLEGWLSAQRDAVNERAKNRRYLVRLITESGLSGFCNPNKCFVPAKKNAYRYDSLRAAVATRDLCAKHFKSAWIVFDYIGD